MSYSGRDLLLGGMFLSLALVFPILFHALGLGGAFLPMFFPMIIAGFLVSFPVAVVVGFVSPLLSAFLTGMPPFFPPIAFILMIEGVVLTGIPALLHQKYGLKVWPTLIITLMVDRLVLVIGVVLSALWLNIPKEVLGLAALINSLPGIVIIIIVIPPLVKVLQKRMQEFITTE